jgi:hypothetical protein
VQEPLKTPAEYLSRMAAAADDHQAAAHELVASFGELAVVEPHLRGPLEVAMSYLILVDSTWGHIARELRRAATMAHGDRPIDPKAIEKLEAMMPTKDRPS